MNNKFEYVIKIRKEQEKQYLKVYFDVPENVEIMKISYSYPGDGGNSIPTKVKNAIDLALSDNEGNMVGATGTSTLSIVISESYSSPGYKKTPIKKGKWCIICGAYKVSTDFEVKYVVEFVYKKYRYLKGDLHMHSVNSDGKFTVRELGLMAKKKNLDFIITSDHNNFAHNKHLPEISNLNIIPGVELTHYNGHLNIWGLETPYKGSFAVNEIEGIKEIIGQARNNNAVISINHPYCSICPWTWDFDSFDYDTLEIWNGPMRQDNMKTVEWWRKEIAKGRKIPIVGGSDYHYSFFGIFNFFAHPTTRVYAKANTKEDILSAIKSGRSVVTKDYNSSMIYLTCGENVAGDTVNLKEDTKVSVYVDKLLKGHTLAIYSKEGIIHTYRSKKTAPYRTEITINEKGFIRAEILYNPKGFAKIIDLIMTYLTNRKKLFTKIPTFVYAITNPIYFE